MGSRGHRRRLAALAGAGALLATVTIGTVATSVAPPAGATAGPVDLATLPKSMHAAVETQSVTIGNGALSLFVDPGAAYSYSLVNRDDYGEGSIAYDMTARGANVNPGTIAAAVIWAPPSCTPQPNAPCVLSGDGSGVNTGLHEAKGFPAYAEALFPPPPSGPSQERVYKCVVNKDGPGSPPTAGQLQQICQAGGDNVPMTAWAETAGAEVRASGFSRAAGFDIPGALSVGGSESFTDVKPAAGGLLHATGYSEVHDIAILGGQVRIQAVRSTAEILAGVGGAAKTLSSSCTLNGLTVAGQPVSMSGNELPAKQLQPLLDAVQKATSIKVEIDAPTLGPNSTDESGKHSAGCAGPMIKLTDLRTEPLAPVCAPIPPSTGVPGCIPALGNREELSFGHITAVESVNAFTAVAGDLTSTVAGAVDAGTATVGSAGGAGTGAGGVGSPSSDSMTAAGAPSMPGGAGSSVGRRGRGSVTRLVKPNLASVAGLAAGAAGSLALGVWLLIGVVGSLARGTSLRLPGL
ncbi:MAG: hypothetical protein JWO37_435 [Acidimicrobiales bacterium]|jgi:hypothetical protein|nr:hypothetical protein [Acidimicrobiales bacterium]